MNQHEQEAEESRLQFALNNPPGPRHARLVATPLPTDPKARKDVPLVAGLLDYFPAALAEVAIVSRVGNEQHNPGQPMHHARGKSTDEADCLVRHLMDRGTVDTDGVRHTAKVAWRALSLLQKELEAAGLAPLARGARLPESPADQLAWRHHPIVQPEPGLYEVGTDGFCKFTPIGAIKHE